MDESTRERVLSTAEELFDAELLHKLAVSVKEVRRRKALRFWQEEPLTKLASQTEVDVASPKVFISVFKGTVERFPSNESPDPKAVEEHNQAVKEFKKQIGSWTDQARRRNHPAPDEEIQLPLNGNAERIGFRVTYSLQESADIGLDRLKKRNSAGETDPFDILGCSELIRAHHLGADVSAEGLMSVAPDVARLAAEYFRDGKTDLDGWSRQLTEGLFLCCYCGFDDELAGICQWATPRKTPDPLVGVDQEVLQLHLVLASLFQPDPASGFRPLLKKHLASRKARVRIFAELVDAVQKSDQPAFEEATRKAIQNFKKRKRPVPNSTILGEWLPAQIDTAYRVGLHRGMAEGDFSEGVSAYLCGSFDGVCAANR